jgi:hypothetical protein
MRKPREEAAAAAAKRRGSSTPRPRSQEKAPWASQVQLPHDDSPEPERAPTPPFPAAVDPEDRDVLEWRPTAVKRKRSSASSATSVRVAALPDEGEESDGTRADQEHNAYAGVTSRRRSSHARASSGEGRRYSATA